MVVVSLLALGWRGSDGVVVSLLGRFVDTKRAVPPYKATARSDAALGRLDHDSIPTCLDCW